MANSSAATALGTLFDTEQIPGGDHRQVICLGSKSVEGDVAPVLAVYGLAVHLRPMTSGGTSTDRTITTAGTNAKSIKSTAGMVFSVTIINVSATNELILAKLFDKASAPTVGTDTAVMPLAGQVGVPIQYTFPYGREFTNGIALAILKGATAIADTDTTATALNDAVVLVEFE